MSTESAQNGGLGVAYPEKQALLVAERAIRNRWGFSDAQREEMRELCVRVAREATSIRDKLLALRVAGYLDEIDRRRDRDEAEQRQREQKTATDFLSSVLAQPGGAELLASSAEEAQRRIDCSKIEHHPGGGLCCGAEEGGGEQQFHPAADKSISGVPISQQEQPEDKASVDEIAAYRKKRDGGR